MIGDNNMKCENCYKKLSRIRNIFKKYPFALQSLVFHNQNWESETIYYCDGKCQLEYIISSFVFLNKSKEKTL